MNTIKSDIERLAELWEAYDRLIEEGCEPSKSAQDTLDWAMRRDAARAALLAACQQGEVHVVLDGPTKSGTMVVHPEQPEDGEHWPSLQRVRVVKVTP